MIKAEIVCDSINDFGNRIISYILTYPRFIHSELMTHRMFSRNASSSRAIPVEKMVNALETEPAMPISWGKNKKGMQAVEELDSVHADLARRIWIESRDRAIVGAKGLLALGVHKQVANRLLEPFAHMTTLVTATEWGNFFNQRAHPDAQPEFQELAFQMLELYIYNEPVHRGCGKWHLPFADKYIEKGLFIDNLLKISTARAARVSYTNFEGDIDHEKDYKLHDDLVASNHWSPFEHAAYSSSSDNMFKNFRGWVPYRNTFTGRENQSRLSPATLMANRRR